MLKDSPKAKGAKGSGSNQYQVRCPKGTAAPTLTDLGLTKKTSSIAQKVASLPDELRNMSGTKTLTRFTDGLSVQHAVF